MDSENKSQKKVKEDKERKGRCEVDCRPRKKLQVKNKKDLEKIEDSPNFSPEREKEEIIPQAKLQDLVRNIKLKNENESKKVEKDDPMKGRTTCKNRDAIKYRNQPQKNDKSDQNLIIVKIRDNKNEGKLTLDKSDDGTLSNADVGECPISDEQIQKGI